MPGSQTRPPTRTQRGSRSFSHFPLLTISEIPCYYPLTMNNRLLSIYAVAKSVCPSTMGGAFVLTNEHICKRAEVYQS